MSASGTQQQFTKFAKTADGKIHERRMASLGACPHGQPCANFVENYRE